MMKVLRNNIVFFVFNLIAFCLLYFIIIFPIKYQYCYESDSINIYQHNEKLNITDIPDFFFKNLNNIEIVDNEYITFDDEIILEINKNDLHKRGVGEISIIGKYNSYDDLKNFLSQLNVSEKFDTLIKENKIIIYQEENTICILFIEPYNQIRINYRTKLPYKIVYTDQEFDKVQNYYLMKNVKKHLYISKLINEKYINIFIIIIFLDVLILIIDKFNKKQINSVNNLGKCLKKF